MRDGALDEEYVGQIVAAFGIKRDRVRAHQWAATDQLGRGPVADGREVFALRSDLSVIPTAMVGAVGACPTGPSTP